MRYVKCLVLAAAAIGAGVAYGDDDLAAFNAKMAERYTEMQALYNASPFSALTTDYFSRFSLDPDAQTTADEVRVDNSWTLALPDNPAPVTQLMADHFADFMARRMDVTLQREAAAQGPVIALVEQGGGESAVEESFTIAVTASRIEVRGHDANGLRDGIVKLVDLMGLRQVPILAMGETVYTPRLAVRVGSLGSHMHCVFMGHNAVQVAGGSLYALSMSDAIPELAERRVPGAIEANAQSVAEAKKYGLKTYAHLSTVEKFTEDHPIFSAHPDIKGARVWKADGEFTMCTEHPLVKQWLSESVGGLFKAVPDLDGIQIIIGGEGFYHCFMRPYGVEKGHTNCPRCEAIGAEQVVANLCNLMAEAARQYNPNAVVLAWPYSAEHVWSKDRAQADFIARLKPGTGILTETVKDEVVEKEGGIRKALWDYSIDMIGPGDRAKAQIAACQAAGIPLRMLSMAEETFESSNLPNIPCMDRWMDRADAMCASGAESSYIWQMGPYHGSVSTEAYKFNYWEPLPDREAFMQTLAARVAGQEAGPELREAWRLVSEAIPYTPEIGGYYKGPHYLGPAHPMIADPNAEVPQVFNGYYLFLGEMGAKEGMNGLPAYDTKANSRPALFLTYYTKLRDMLQEAANHVDQAADHVPERCRMTFEAEANPIRWFYRIARTQANFTRSCMIRDRLAELTTKPARTPEEQAEAAALVREWLAVLRDEQANSQEALPIAEADVRLDTYHRGDASFSHTVDMVRAKLELIAHEIDTYVPSVAAKLGVAIDA